MIVGVSEAETLAGCVAVDAWFDGFYPFPGRSTDFAHGGECVGFEEYGGSP